MVIKLKNLHSKTLKRKFNIFQLLTSVIAEFPPSNFIFVLSTLQFICQDLAIACKSFDMRKKHVLIIGI